MLSRRALLGRAAFAAAAGLAPIPGLGRLAFGAAAPSDRILVVLHLRGGCDGLNLLSPAGDPEFIAARSSELRVASDGTEAGFLIPHAQNPALEFRLHHAAAGLAELAAGGHLAFVHAAGLTDATRSHFVATDLIEHGVADGAALNRIPSGWLARALAERGGSGVVRGVSTSNTPSGVWAGDRDTISVADLANGLGPPGGPQTGSVLSALYGTAGTPGATGDSVTAAGRLTLASMRAIDARLARDAQHKYLPYLSAAGVNYEAAYELGRPLKTLAQLIKMDLGLQAATVDFGGWDTHEYQPGRFRNQVDRLSHGLSAFYNDLSNYQRRLSVVVVTEFGRRLRSNRSAGTDHGRGSVMLVLGGQVAGGKIYGQWPGLNAEQLDEGVDLAVVNDYRQVLGEVVGQWRGEGNSPLLFPGFSSQTRSGLFV